MSEQLVMIGTSFRRVGFERLGRYVLPLESRADAAGLRTALGARELVYVATCNRVEMYAAGPLEHEGVRGAEGGGELATKAASYFTGLGRGPTSAQDFSVLRGERALDHLFSVVASLDSLVLGECEIAGQVRRAVETARAHGLSGPYLERVFQQAGRVAKRIRSETAIGRTPVSVASLVLRRIREHFRDGRPRRAVLVGVGDVTKKVATALGGTGTRTLFVNRTASKAAELAARFGGESMSLESFRAAPPADLDLIVTATRAPEAIIDASTLAPSLAGPRAERLLVCDLGVPPDVDAAVAADPRLRLLSLPDLETTARENRERLAGEAAHVKEIVTEEVRRFAGELRTKALASESVDAVLAGRLAHLAPEDRETVRRFAVGLAERIARQPSAQPARASA